MHELPVTKSILEIVLRHAESADVGRVRRIHLSIGALSDLEPEWIQEYFDRLSRGTMAEGASLEVQRQPLSCSCERCEAEFTCRREDLDGAACPACGSNDYSVLSGTGYMVESMEVDPCPT